MQSSTHRLTVVTRVAHGGIVGVRNRRVRCPPRNGSPEEEPRVPPSLRDELVKRIRFCMSYINDEYAFLPNRHKKKWISARLITYLESTSADDMPRMNDMEISIVDRVVEDAFDDLAK